MREIEKRLYGNRSSTPNLEGGGGYDIGYDNIEVTLLAWPFQAHRKGGVSYGTSTKLYDAIWQATMTSWRTDIPIEVEDEPEELHITDPVDGTVRSDWIYASQKQLVIDVLEGRMLPNILEAFQFTFVITGVTRVATHQIVRSRQGVVFNQFSTRFANVEQTRFRIPPELDEEQQASFKESCEIAKSVYTKLVSAGIHEQLARYILPDSIETAITESWNFMALRGYTRQRACSIMQSEHRVIAEKMIHAVREKFPLLAKYMYPSCWEGRCMVNAENIKNLQLPYNETAQDLMCDCPGWKKVKDSVMKAAESQDTLKTEETQT